MTPVGSIQALVSQRRAQGWRQTIPPLVRKQLVEVHAQEASVCSITVLPTPGNAPSTVDDAGTLTIETRIGEALRTRSFRSRWAGQAFNVPSGITRIWCEADFQKTLETYVQMAPGFSSLEHQVEQVFLAGAAVITLTPPPFSRSVTIYAATIDVRVQLPFASDAYLYTPSGNPGGRASTGTFPALASVSVANNTLGGGFIVASWEVQA